MKAQYLGGPKTSGLRVYFERGRLRIAWRHIPMTWLARHRFLNSTRRSKQWHR